VREEPEEGVEVSVDIADGHHVIRLRCGRGGFSQAITTRV
jgi:hypothetical protein